MKAIVWIGAVLAMLIGLGGLISVIVTITEPGTGPLVGLAVLMSDFVFIALLAVVQCLADIRALLKVSSK